MHFNETTTTSIIKQRQDRHRRLMRMIKNYKPASQEVKALEKIKNNTTLQINLRYIRSEHNRYYRFPKQISEVSDDDDGRDDNNPFTFKQNIMYDLKTQNQIKPKAAKSISNQLESSHRVKSLERQRTQVGELRLGRIQQLKKHELSYKKIRKKSMAEQKRVFSTIKLPQLKKQHMNTDFISNSPNLHKIIGKKLNTQANSPAKNQASDKYLKREQQRKQRRKKFVEFRKVK